MNEKQIPKKKKEIEKIKIQRDCENDKENTNLNKINSNEN